MDDGGTHLTCLGNKMMLPIPTTFSTYRYYFLDIFSVFLVIKRLSDLIMFFQVKKRMMLSIGNLFLRVLILRH